jgi:Fe-S cluster assembly iron-binding protein IscA
MLQVTDRAATAFKEILAADDVAGEAIRLTPGSGPDATGFDILAITEPHADDVPTQAEGIDVFVAPELADALDRLVLDADDAGQAFFVRPQASPN